MHLPNQTRALCLGGERQLLLALARERARLSEEPLVLLATLAHQLPEQPGRAEQGRVAGDAADVSGEQRHQPDGGEQQQRGDVTSPRRAVYGDGVGGGDRPDADVGAWRAASAIVAAPVN